MKDDDQSARINQILKAMATIDKEIPTGPDESYDPEIQELIEDAARSLEQLDPLVREAFRDHPEKLAEWDSIMHMCDADDEIDEAKKLGTPDAPVIRLEDEAVQ